MSTVRLYYTDSYLASFEATVVDAADDGLTVFLDRSAFYPASGGQPHDLGTCAGVAVTGVEDREDRIAHRLGAPVPPGPVACEVDWPRRYDHMQQHTGQHLLSAVLVELFGVETLSFHMGSDVSTIELSAAEFDDAQVERAELRAAELIREARPVRVCFEDAAAAGGLRKPSGRSGLLRVVQIDGLDRSACGGTHLRSTAEVGPLLIRRREKVRGNVRLEFVCGGRALSRAARDFRQLTELSRLLSASIDDLPPQVEALRARLAASEKENRRMALELAQREGRERYAATAAAGDGLKRLHLAVDSIGDDTRAFAQAFVECGAAAVFVAGREPSSVLLAVSPDSGLHAGALLKAALQPFGGRGGGSAGLAQGSLPDHAAAAAIAGTLGFPATLPR